MSIKLPFVEDPKTKEPSVSLSLLLISFLALLVACFLHLTNFTEHTSALTELFYANVALYFGRRVGIGSKFYSADPTASTTNTKE